MSFSFGAPTSAPANTGLTGFSFGANKPATATSFGLGAPAAASTGLFGSTATSAAPLSFGATTTPAFGATTTPAFGAANTGFGATATSGFGATATPAFGAATSTAPAFGATTSTAPAFGATTSTAPAFGATTAPGTGLTGGLNFGAGSNAPATGLSFGAAPTASTGLGGFGMSSTAGTATTQSTGFGLFGANTSTLGAAAPGFFGAGARLGTTAIGTQPTSTAAPSLGLGGVSTTSSVFGANTSTTGDGKGDPPKQTKLPNEISTTVENFKEFVKKQKSLSSDISRVSIKPIQKVSREVEELSNSVCAALSAARSCRASAARLRSGAAAALRSADTMPQYPPGTVLESSAPPQFIKDLISDLEQQLLAFRRQMDVADKQMQAAPKLLTEQELTLGIRRMHESLVALAGRLQAVHTQVEAQKEQYLNLRKYVLKDPTNVFEEVSASSSFEQLLKGGEVQSKKSKMSTFGDVSASSLLSDPKSALSNIQQLAGPSPFSSFGLSSYPGADFSGTASWQPSQPAAPINTSFNSSFTNFSTPAANSSFQLQKPPGKRGKQ